MNTTQEHNLFRSEFYMCVPSLVKIVWEMPVKIQDGRHKSFFFVISTSDRGDFPRIIEIALFFIYFMEFVVRATSTEDRQWISDK